VLEAVDLLAEHLPEFGEERSPAHARPVAR
jgi:hypothetical protein